MEAHLRGESDRFAIEHRALHKDGRWIWILDRGKVVERGEDGKPTRMAGTYTDISARHEAESALQASEARFRELFHAVPALLWTIDPDGSVTDCNGAWCEFTGLTRAQSLGIGWMEALHPDDRATTRAAVTDALARGALYQVEQRLRRTDGEYRWFLTRGTPVRDATGRIVRWHGANVDISERKQAEAALQESERRFRALVDSAPVGVFLTDANGQSVYQNPVADEIMGMSIGQARGLGWQAAIAPEDRELLAREWQGAVKTGKTFRTEASLTMADGTRKRVEAHASPMHGPRGDFTGFIGVMINVTDQRALQEKVAQSARLAAMGTLVAGVAHEINNPLTALTACTGVALEDVRELQGMLRAGTAPDPDRLARRSQDVVEMLGDVEAGAARIARIVRDLTILGRPEQRRDRVRLADVMTGALKWLPDLVANRATIRTEVRAVPDVIASASQVELVLINLVTNAALSIPEGRTGEVVVRVLPGSASGVRIEVSDNGSGIAPELMKRIFEPFFTTRAQGTGTGLGLSICNAIVEAHGGTLTVQSEVGKGSMFRVGLPAASTEV